MKNLKTTLVHTGISGCGFNSFGKGIDPESTWINHGLCSISAYTKSKGFYVDLIDLRKLKGWNDFEKDIDKREPDVVGLGMMTVDFNYVMRCIDLVKKVNKKIKVIVGGVHPTLMLEEVANNPKIDHIVLGEGEISFTKLLEDIQKGKKNIERIIQGIKPNLDELPFVDRDLYGGLCEEPLLKGSSSPFVTIIAGRGCIYNCSFCQPAERIIFGPRVRRRSVNNVIKELIILRKKYKFRSLMLHDDCLTEDKNWVNEFCEKYEKNNFNQPFICQTRVDIICKNEKLVKRMCKAGLSMFIIGFESGSQRVLNFLRKGTTVEQNYGAAEICKKYGIRIWANYMLGIPTETRKEVMATAEMIKKIKPYHYSPAFFTPYPGSDLFKYCMGKKLLKITDYDDYRRGTYSPKIKGVNYEGVYESLLESYHEVDKKHDKLRMKRSNCKSVNKGLLELFLGVKSCEY